MSKSDKFFTIGLLVSLVLHGFVFVDFVKNKEKIKKLEELKKQTKEEVVREMLFKKQKPKHQPVSARKYMQKVSAKKDIQRESERGVVPVPLVKEKFKLPSQFQTFERKPQKLAGVKVERQVAVPVIKSGKINSPAYVTYYQIVRDRIRQKAYNNYLQLKSGDVYLTFVLLANGQLKDIKIIEEHTSDNEYLKQVGIKSVKEAGPFPSFPEDLKYPELTFNVVISFQFKEDM